MANLRRKMIETDTVGLALAHDSAALHVSGTATYIDDISEVRGTLHAAPIVSKVAHGRLLGVDASAALALEIAL